MDEFITIKEEKILKLEQHLEKNSKKIKVLEDEVSKARFNEEKMKSNEKTL